MVADVIVMLPRAGLKSPERTAAELAHAARVLGFAAHYVTHRRSRPYDRSIVARAQAKTHPVAAAQPVNPGATWQPVREVLKVPKTALFVNNLTPPDEVKRTLSCLLMS